MPSFAYRGLNAQGKSAKGVLDAETPKALRMLLRKEGIFVTDVHEASERGKVQGDGLSREVDFKTWFDRISVKDIAGLTRELATLLRAGIPLTEAISALVDGTASDALRRVLADIRSKVNEGTSLAEALAGHPKQFTNLYVNMVRAGETAGNLEHVLTRLATFLDAQIRLRNKIQSALMYPVIMAIVSLAITTMLMVVVVPQITQIFADTGRALPWNTQLLIWVSDITGSYWGLLVLAAMIGLGVAFHRWKHTPRGKARWDRLTLVVWRIGPLIRKITISRFSRTLGTLLSSGVPLLKALEIVEAILGNTVFVAIVEKARIAIREGDTIADPLQRSGEFPPVVTRMITVGERSGQLETMLESIADSYENEVDIEIGRLTSLIEPLMIVVMGGIVGFIVFSILMPILDMNELIG